jgi:putative ABC transport system permease protein
MRAINHKLQRELWQMRGQAMAITLVIASGIATYVMSLSALDSLLLTRDIYYRDYRFAEVFASLKRAPESLASRIRAIPGVARAETRVVASVTLDVAGFADPVSGLLISVPDFGEPLLNRLYLRQGRMVRPDRDDEVLVHEAFAQAHGLKTGDTLAAVINGRRKRLRIVGIALSPEYIYQLAPGSTVPDFKRFGVLWMVRTPLASAYDMESAFNNVTLTLASRTRLEDVLDRLDTLLDRYGGQGAYGRKDQISHHFLAEELRQLETLATLFPIIFFGVAAFLLNVVVTRLINQQREEIAALKAFGYSNLDVGLHYVKLVVVVVLIGILIGLAGGVWLGRSLSGVYMEFYRFPFLNYKLRPVVVATATLISIGVAVLGTLRSVRAAAQLPPAQAMRPEPPGAYREALIERVGLKRFLSQPTRMIGRHIERSPVKTLLSVIGIALACGIMMTGRFSQDSIDYMMEVQFRLSQREDLAVTFVEPTSWRALHSLLSLPGITYGEVYRTVPVRLKFEHRSYRTVIQSIEPDAHLQRLLDVDLRPIDVPPQGIVLTDHLAKILAVSPGDWLTVEVLEGNRPVRRLPVVALANQYIGVFAYMQRAALNRLMREGNAISGANLSVDSLYQPQVYARLKEIPRIAATTIRKQSVASFQKLQTEMVLFYTFVATLLGATIAFGVVYNTARIALAERSRELASLRVLGFTRWEISYILLGELGVITLAAIPLGFLAGILLCALLVSQMQTDLYRVPLVISPSTYAFAAAVVLGSACISAFAVRRKLDDLDLVAVLKTKQ